MYTLMFTFYVQTYVFRFHLYAHYMPLFCFIYGKYRPDERNFVQLIASFALRSATETEMIIHITHKKVFYEGALRTL